MNKPLIALFWASFLSAGTHAPVAAEAIVGPEAEPAVNEIDALETHAQPDGVTGMEAPADDLPVDTGMLPVNIEVRGDEGVRESLYPCLNDRVGELEDVELVARESESAYLLSVSTLIPETEPASELMLVSVDGLARVYSPMKLSMDTESYEGRHYRDAYDDYAAYVYLDVNIVAGVSDVDKLCHAIAARFDREVLDFERQANIVLDTGEEVPVPPESVDGEVPDDVAAESVIASEGSAAPEAESLTEALPEPAAGNAEMAPEEAGNSQALQGADGDDAALAARDEHPEVSVPGTAGLLGAAP